MHDSTTKKQLIEKMDRGAEYTYIYMTNKHTKRCSISLIIKEVQIKTTMRYQSMSIRMAIIKKTRNKLERIWRKGDSYTLSVGM